MMGRRQSISFAWNPRFCLEEEQKVTVKSRSWILSVQGICIRTCLYSKNVCDEAPFQYGFCCFTRHGVLCSPFDRCHGLSCNARNQHGQVHIVTLFEVRSSSVHFVCALFIFYGANIRLERLYWRIHAKISLQPVRIYEPRQLVRMSRPIQKSPYRIWLSDELEQTKWINGRFTNIAINRLKTYVLFWTNMIGNTWIRGHMGTYGSKEKSGIRERYSMGLREESPEIGRLQEELRNTRRRG